MRKVFTWETARAGIRTLIGKVCPLHMIGRREKAQSPSRGHVIRDSDYRLVTSGEIDQIDMKNNEIHVS